MINTRVSAINRSVQETYLWLQELAQDGGFYDERQAYSALRSVLHVLRDRLTVDEAAHLSAQMPMVVRGLFFEGWSPADCPCRIRSLDEFLCWIDDELGLNSEVDAETAARAVFGLLERKISAGEIDDVRHMLPREIQMLWPGGEDEFGPDVRRRAGRFARMTGGPTIRQSLI